jgi:hypothetical protein
LEAGRVSPWLALLTEPEQLLPQLTVLALHGAVAVQVAPDTTREPLLQVTVALPL